MRLHEGLTCAACLSLLSACATSSLNMAPDRPDAPWRPATSANGEIVAGPPADGQPTEGYVLPSNAALAVLPSPTKLEAGHAYTLAELIDIAERNNPETRIAWDDARNAALAAGIAQSAFLPNLSAAVIGGYQSGHDRQSLSGNATSGSESGNGSISSLSLQWLLFDFGQRAANLDAAKQASVISNIGFTAAHQNLIYRVSLAFYADAAARARQVSAGQSLADATAIQAAAESRFKAGTGTVVETAEARQASAQAEFSKVQADGDAQDARQALINAIGLSPLTQLTVEDVSHRSLSASAQAPIEQMVSAAIARRPDMLSAYAAHQASLARVRAAQAEFMPKVFVTATGAYTSGDLQAPALPGFGQNSTVLDLSGNKFGGTVLLGITIPLYDGGVRRAALSQAQSGADRAEQKLIEVRNEAVRQIVSGGNTARSSVADFEAAQALLSASQTSFDAALTAYRNGVGSITAVTMAEAKLLEARNISTTAYSNALSAAAGLALAVGALGSPPDSDAE
jgi:outer membrane protein